MLELRNEWSYWRKPNPDGSTHSSGRDWVRTYVCLGGLRLVAQGRVRHSRWGADFGWRWSWRGTSFHLGKIILSAGWIAPQFRSNN